MTESLACIASSSHVLPLQTGLPYTGPTPSDSQPLLSPALLCFQSFNMAGTYSFLSLPPSLPTVCVCVCVCGCLTDSHLCAPTLSPSRSLSLSPSVVFSLKLTHTLYRSISYCLSLAHAHSLSPSRPLSLTRSISRSLSHALSLSLLRALFLALSLAPPSPCALY